jgi:CBS-domain-containing membrane protein
MSINNILRIIGAESHNIGHAEKVISAVGGFIGILLAMWISLYYVGAQGAALITASMGASAVLLYAAPHSPLAQPWPLIGGNVISALVGVSCAQLIPNPLLAAPTAVALAIVAMHYLRCLHPPGGGTVLAAVVGGADVHALGYQFVLTPVLLNVSIMLITAIMLNYAFPWRRYPASFKKQPAKEPVQSSRASDKLGHADFEFALNEIGSFVDITEDDLARIYRLALKHAQQLSYHPEKIAIGNYYSNGESESSAQWSVRKIVELAGNDENALVTYKIVDGKGKDSVTACTLSEFNNWQKYEVILKQGTWHRIMHV